MNEKGTWYDHLTSSYEEARQRFSFLQDMGFKLSETVEATGNNSRYDGWHFVWKGPIEVRLEYYEWELYVTFNCKGIDTSYMFLDHNLFDNKSGFHGLMFGPDKISMALKKMAIDVAQNYVDILRGDVFIWKRVKGIVEQANQESETIREKERKKDAFRFERIDAKEAFQCKDYKKVVELLKEAEPFLEPLELRKLEYSKKKVKDNRWWLKLLKGKS